MVVGKQTKLEFGDRFAQIMLIFTKSIKIKEIIIYVFSLLFFIYLTIQYVSWKKKFAFLLGKTLKR